MQRKTVLLVFGGESSEHEVSISSARNVFAAIDNTKFKVELAFIDRDGRWWLLDEFGDEINTHGALQLIPALGTGSFTTLPNSRIVTPQVILPILHGKNGEDGALAALGSLLHIPVVGCDMTAGAICMDKVATKEILVSHAIDIIPYEVHRVGDVVDFGRLSTTLGVPLFVKPSRAGSSVGVNKVYSEDELLAALKTAHQHDDVALIERGVTAREIEVAVLGNIPNHTVSVAGEIVAEGDFYSYDSKYAATSQSQTIVPAILDDEVAAKIQTLAKDIYTYLGCGGLARIDFFVTDEGMIYLNEVNTLPGFTNISMYPKLWRASGIAYGELIEKLIETAGILKE